MAVVVQGDEQKLRELVLYIATKCERDHDFGMVTLHTMLFLCDFYGYANLGRPVTGVEYMKLPQGPVPRRMAALREDMLKRGEIIIREEPVWSLPNPRQRVIPLRSPDLSSPSSTARE